jgi:glycosyltransferase involved in cell wall biosynthesis
MLKNKNKKANKFPFVSVCTPTFNRKPFVNMMIKCFESQTYPKDRVEWLILDDGTDKIEDYVKHIHQVKYFRYEEKMTLGRKRNILNDNAKGDIIVYMDDDDYYPPERISHAVETLKNSPALCAGSSAMLIYFKHINKMYQFGPYSQNHATAATFAFKKELLTKTRFSELSSVAEEKQFLKDYTIPFVQLDSRKSILVFSHEHNSFDKKELLKQMPNPTIHDSLIVPSDLIKDPEILKFFMEDIDNILKDYEPGRVENKKDVTKQLKEIKETREKMMKEQQQQMQQNNQANIQNILNQQNLTIQQLQFENETYKNRIEYLEKKISEIIQDKIKEKTANSNTC